MSPGKNAWITFLTIDLYKKAILQALLAASMASSYSNSPVEEDSVMAGGLRAVTEKGGGPVSMEAELLTPNNEIKSHSTQNLFNGNQVGMCIIGYVTLASRGTQILCSLNWAYTVLPCLKKKLSQKLEQLKHERPEVKCLAAYILLYYMV